MSALTPALRFEDVNNTINVDIITSITNPDSDLFTIFQISENILGSKNRLIELGFDILEGLTYSIGEAKTFAYTRDLKLILVMGKEETVLQDFSGIYYNGGLGLDNL